MQGQNIRHKVQIVISGAFNNKSVHFVGVIIVQHTEVDDIRYCKYTIVLLKMSTAMLETC
jgi:hypothetical protein